MTTSEVLKYDLFLCYAAEDIEAVADLAGRMRVFGARVWHDKDVIGPGDSIRHAIEGGIEASRYVGLVLSNASVAKLRDRSGYIGFEEYIASIEQDLGGRTRIIPILIDAELAIPDLPPKYRDRRFVNLADYPSELRELLSFLELTALPTRLTNIADGTGLVHVPAGVYTWGDPGLEAPIKIEAFYVGESMVSWSQYENFLRDVSGSPDPSAWSPGLLPLDFAVRNHHSEPIIGVDFPSAHAYCESAFLRLPTAYELEYLVLDAEAHGVRVSELDANSRVAEWTSTSAFDFAKRPDDEARAQRMVLWSCFEMRRGFQLPFNVENKNFDVGFRCAADSDLAYSHNWAPR